MSSISKLDNIFKVLNQDHSYFLTYPTISISQNNRKTKNHIEVASLFHYSREEKNAAAAKITKSLGSFRHRNIFKKLKYTIYSLMRENQALVLRRLDPKCFSIFEKDKYTVVFRLAGETFPPHIVYKIFGRQYVISSYNFPIIEAQQKTKNKSKYIENGSTNSHSKKHEAWRICYVYKHEITTKRTTDNKSLNSYRKNTNFITWITEKYGC